MSDTTYNWVGNAWQYNKRNEYTAYNDTIVEVSYTWKNDVWEGISKKESYSGENEKWDLTFEWVDGDWKEKSGTKTKTNNDTVIVSNWNAILNAWALTVISKHEEYRDSNDSITSKSIYNWSNADNKWLGVSRDSFAYNVHDIMIVHINYTWNNNWVNNTKTESAYDKYGNKTLDASYDWDGKAWIGKTKTVYSFGADSLVLSYTWNSTTNAWEGDKGGRHLREYDKNNDTLITLDVTLTWKKAINAWAGVKNKNKYEYSYDNNGNRTSEAVYTWNNTTNVWVGTGNKFEYEYNGNNNITKFTTFAWNKNEWASVITVSFYYTQNPPTAIIETTDNATVTVYPNPTADVVYFDVESRVKVYNMQGVLLQELFGKQVNLSNYPQGIYLLQINGVWNKIVKK